jgi:hypothetical protein
MNYDNDSIIGYQVLNNFLKYFNFDYSKNLVPDDVAKAINLNHPEVIIDGLGLMARVSVDNDSSKIDEAMKNLSEHSDGKIPGLSSFSYAFTLAAQNTSVWDATKFVAVESAKEIGTGAVYVGNAVINSGKLVLFLLPLGIVAFIYFYGKNTLKRIS